MNRDDEVELFVPRHDRSVPPIMMANPESLRPTPPTDPPPGSTSKTSRGPRGASRPNNPPPPSAASSQSSSSAGGWTGKPVLTSKTATPVASFAVDDEVADMIDEAEESLVHAVGDGEGAAVVPVMVVRALDPKLRAPRIPRSVLEEKGFQPNAQAELMRYKRGSSRSGRLGRHRQGAMSVQEGVEDDVDPLREFVQQRTREEILRVSQRHVAHPALPDRSATFTLRTVREYLYSAPPRAATRVTEAEQRRRAQLDELRERNIALRAAEREKREAERMASVRAQHEDAAREREQLLRESKEELRRKREAERQAEEVLRAREAARQQVFLARARKQYELRLAYIIQRRKETRARENAFQTFCKNLRDFAEAQALRDKEAARSADLARLLEKKRALSLAKRERRLRERELRRIEEKRRRIEAGIRPAFMMFDTESRKSSSRAATIRKEEEARRKRAAKIASKLVTMEALMADDISHLTLHGSDAAVTVYDGEDRQHTSKILEELAETEEQREARIARARMRTLRLVIAGDTMLFGRTRKGDLLGLKKSLLDQAKERQPTSHGQILSAQQVAAMEEEVVEEERRKALAQLAVRRANRIAIKERLRHQRFGRDLKKLIAEREAFLEKYNGDVKACVDAMRWHFLGVQSLSVPKLLASRLKLVTLLAAQDDAKLRALRTNPSYKTKLCLFRSRKACPHGKYCPFAHGQADLSYADSDNFITWK
jgi:hypothetical protein